MELLERATLLAQKDPDLRRDALEQALTQAGLPYTTQCDESGKRLRPAQNYLLHLGESTGARPIFCAHYDAFAGSFGANDNAAAVSILIAFAQQVQAAGIPADFAFFDAEEDGRAGSRLYVSTLRREQISGVINLDLCGYGDTIVLLDKGYLKKPALRPFAAKELLAAHQAQLVKFLPEGDDVSFRGTHLPVTSLALVPRWDVQYLRTLATYGGGLLGRPPEFEMILNQMEVVTTMHGSFRDTPAHLSAPGMTQVLSYLLAAFLP